MDEAFSNLVREIRKYNKVSLVARFYPFLHPSRLIPVLCSSSRSRLRDVRELRERRAL